MSLLRSTLSILLFLLLSGSAFSQNGVIRGFVYDKANGEPSIYTSVYIQGTQLGASTDINGFFTITKVPAGSYTLIVTYVGYDTLRTQVSVKDGEIVNRKLYITEKVMELSEIDISAEKQEAQTEVRASVTKVTPKEIKQVVTVGGEADIAQYLQIIPGIVSTGDQGGQLYIRGGSPVQNKVLLDGMTIYNPFHTIGLFSVFDADIIRNAEVYTAGYNAEYGGRTSSVMDITTRDGNKKRFGGKLSATPFVGKLLLEGPLKKQVSDEDGAVTFLFSARTSYLQQTSPVLYKYVDETAKVPIPYNFRDLYGKLSFNSNNGSKLNLFGFNFKDSVDFVNQSNMNWSSTGAGGNFVVIPGSSAALINGFFSVSNYKIGLTNPNEKPRESSISGFNFGLNFNYYFGRDELKYGIDLQAYGTNFSYHTPISAKIDIKGQSTEIVGFMKYRKVFDKLVLEPGLHVRYYANLSVFSPEPRFGLKYNITNNLRFKLAGGLYSQNLVSAQSDLDIVNLFYGFLMSPENTKPTYGGETMNNLLQKSRHIVGGFEIDLTRNLSLNLEAYVKDMNQLININRNKLFDNEYDFIYEKGRAKGIDALLKYEFKRLYLWAAYSYTIVTREYEKGNILASYYPNFDRRHNLSLVGSYVFGKGLNWELDVRWNLGSGFAFTQTKGFYQKQTFSQGPYTPYPYTNGNLTPILGNLNEGRLPYYHRFDASIKRKFEVAKNSVLEINIGATNMYNRQNVFYVDRITNKRVNQLPFLPSAGVSLTF